MNNLALKVFIMHFNYTMDGTQDWEDTDEGFIPYPNIILGGFKDSSGIDIALIDSYLYQASVGEGIKAFNMYHNAPHSTEIEEDDDEEYEVDVWHTTENVGGWKGTDFRYDILGATSTPPSGYGSILTSSRIGYNATQDTIDNPVPNNLMAALPNEFRSVLKLWPRHLDVACKYNSNSSNATIEEAIDAITLLTEMEVLGSFTANSNQYECQYVMQLQYFANGNAQTRIRRKYNNTNSKVEWVLASCVYNHSYTAAGFHHISTTGTKYQYLYESTRSTAIAPAFKV